MHEEAVPSRLLRVLMWSVPLGRISGIQVRLYWTAGLVFLFGWAQYARFLPTGLAAGLAGLSWLALYATVLTHELGHAFAARRWNVPTSRITLSAFGGLAHLQDGMPSPKAEALVSLAGPATHLLWLAVCWPLGEWLGSGWFLSEDGLSLALLPFFVTAAVGINVSLLVFNLLPFFPMDGGRVLRALLARKMHPNLATLWAARVGIFGAIALAAWGLVGHSVWGSLLVLIAINNALACLREMAVARTGDGPYAEPRQPWESDPDAWKSGGGGEVERPSRKRGGLRLLARRAGPRPPDPLVPATEDDDADLDRHLEKVGRVGLAGLTDVERATLQRISEARRRGR